MMAFAGGWWSGPIHTKIPRHKQPNSSSFKDYLKYSSILRRSTTHSMTRYTMQIRRARSQKQWCTIRKNEDTSPNFMQPAFRTHRGNQRMIEAIVAFCWV